MRKMTLYIILAILLLVAIGIICNKSITYSERNPNWVWINGHPLNDAVGVPIVLSHNPQARDPSWEELQTFLKSDTTNELYYNQNSFVCTSFAEILQNNAEAAGIRAAFVFIYFKQGICSLPNQTGCSMACVFTLHACNAFQTTDRGLIYIDDTGTVDGQGVDCTVNISVGQNYARTPIFSNVSVCLMKEVSNFSVFW